MRKHINILSLLVLAVYGALTLVAMPLHQHPMSYVDTPHYQSFITHHGLDCSVCTFNSQSVSVALSSSQCVRATVPSEQLQSVEVPNSYHSQFEKVYPRRGPPSPLS